jgi:CDP-glucose 4,6-dehydratase
MGMNAFGGSYAGRRVLITGHTGFKGSWLALWLQELGAVVAGVALDPPTDPSHWTLLGLSVGDHRTDIRDLAGFSTRYGRKWCSILRRSRSSASPTPNRSRPGPPTSWVPPTSSKPAG